MTIELKSAFKKATISLAASGVGCTRVLDGSFGRALERAIMLFILAVMTSTSSTHYTSE
jgi:hypothetical protein